MDYILSVKKKLHALIHEMAQNCSAYVKNPKTDFSRTRKLSFETMIHLLLSMGGNSIYKELLDYHDYDLQTPTTSAFIQQREKILPSSFAFLLKQFTQSIGSVRLFKGFRLLAIDGSKVNIPNGNDNSFYFKPYQEREGWYCMHLNAIYDLCNKWYLDACMQSPGEANENKAFVTLVERSEITKPVIIIADRGYESYNTFVQTERKGWYYLIRAKDIHSTGILGSFSWPDEAEFDVTRKRIITKKQTKEVLSNPEIYKRIAPNSPFDYIDKNEGETYPITLRVIRFMLRDGIYESIITNLPEKNFSAHEIKAMYHMRWGIETAFRDLKYTVGLLHFHSQKIDFIMQEIYAKMIMYNFCEMITLYVAISKKKKHIYQVNSTVAIQICRYYFRSKCKIRSPDIRKLIQQNLLPIRPERYSERRKRGKRSISFLYRIS